jgi:hypothetical protein
MNQALNHTTRRSLHNPLHLTICASGMGTTTGKALTIKVTRLKVRIGTSSEKTMPM